MKTNMGMNDRVLRMFLGVAIAMFFVYQNSAWALLGLIPFVTGIIGICPLYSLLGINTLRKSHDA
ncbi:MAG: DUF2892 domain-containing protein [Bacteroidia bacterium]|nr:DUF2892 domain-containing protein [Bacteroidia bacterium]